MSARAASQLLPGGLCVPRGRNEGTCHIVDPREDENKEIRTEMIKKQIIGTEVNSNCKTDAKYMLRLHRTTIRYVTGN